MQAVVLAEPTAAEDGGGGCGAELRAAVDDAGLSEELLAEVCALVRFCAADSRRGRQSVDCCQRVVEQLELDLMVYTMVTSWFYPSARLDL